MSNIELSSSQPNTLSPFSQIISDSRGKSFPPDQIEADYNNNTLNHPNNYYVAIRILTYAILTVALITALFLSTTLDIVKSFAQGNDYPVTATNESQEEAQRNRFSAQSNMVETIHLTNGSIKTIIGNPTNITANSKEDFIHKVTEDIKKQIQTNIDKNKKNETTVQIIDQVTGEVIRTQIESPNDKELTEVITKWLQKGPPPRPDYNNSSDISSTSKTNPSSLPREKEITNKQLNFVQFLPYPQTYTLFCDPQFSYWQPHYYGEWQQLSPGYWTYNINWYWHYHCNGYD